MKRDHQKLIESGEFIRMLDTEELAYFTLQTEGRTRSRIAAELGWNSVKIERVRRRLNRRLAQLRSASVPADSPKPISQEAKESIWPSLLYRDAGVELPTKRQGRYRSTTRPPIYSFARGGSLNPYYCERLPSGLSTWTLNPSNQIEVSQLPIVEGPNRTGALIVSNELQKQFDLEAGRLARIAERLHAARIAGEDAARELGAAEGELRAELTNAILEERPANSTHFEKQVSKLQATLAAKRAELTAAESAHRQLAGKVEAIEAEIEAKRHETFLRSTLDQRQRIRRLMEQLSAEVVAYVDVAASTRQNWCDALFPVRGPDFVAGGSYRGVGLQLASTAVALENHAWQLRAGSVLPPAKVA